MAMDRRARSVHERDRQTPAPGDLELVRSFLALHEHEPGDPESLPPSSGTVTRWLRASGLLEGEARMSAEDVAWVSSIREALRAKVLETTGRAPGEVAKRVLNEAVREAGLGVCFGCGEDDRLHATAPGVRGAIGRVLGLAFLAQLDGTWDRFKVCDDPDCRAVFYDRSKNRSGRWCSMESCGNRAKVRAFRERRAAAR